MPIRPEDVPADPARLVAMVLALDASGSGGKTPIPPGSGSGIGDGGTQRPVQGVPGGHRPRHRPILLHRAVRREVAAGADGDGDGFRRGHRVSGEELRDLLRIRLEGLSAELV